MHPQDTTDPAIVRIPLCARDGTVCAYAIIDAADWPLVAHLRWHRHGLGYVTACTRINDHSVNTKLHRLLLGLVRGDGLEVDHLNRDRMDNRRANLRVLPRAARLNAQNRASNRESTSAYRGVSWDRLARKWAATIMVNGRNRRLGRFTREEDAADAAQAARARWMPYAVD